MISYEVFLTEEAFQLLGKINSTTLGPGETPGKIYRHASSPYYLGKYHGFNENSIGYYLREYLYGIVSVLSRAHECRYIVDKKFPRKAPVHTVWTTTGRELKAACIIKGKREGLFIPPRLHESVQSCIDGELVDGRHVFRESVSNESVPVLRYMYERTLELRDKFGDNWYPEFTNTSIANATGFCKSSVRGASRDLVGVLGEKILVDATKRKYVRKVFLPRCRYGLAKQMIEELSQNTEQA
jgi:hypothetical protein